MPGEEPEAGRALRRVLRREGVDVRVGTPVDGLRRTGGSVRVNLGNGDVIASDVLGAQVRRPATVDLGFDRAGVIPNARGFVAVDERLRTTASRAYASAMSPG